MPNSILAGNRMMDIPAGNFQRYDDTVSIKAFKMMEHEVTWDQYQPCIDAGACPEAGDSRFAKNDRPMINVSWEDITQHYIPWLNQATGQTFRLPTEAEWEYAARGGSSTQYSWGDDIDCSKARYGY